MSDDKYPAVLKKEKKEKEKEKGARQNAGDPCAGNWRTMSVQWMVMCDFLQRSRSVCVCGCMRMVDPIRSDPTRGEVM